jgi:hypothetical protein
VFPSLQYLRCILPPTVKEQGTKTDRIHAAHLIAIWK